MYWLLEAGTLQHLANAVRLQTVQPSAEQMATLEARHELVTGSNESRILTIAGNTAEIAVKGLITARPDFFASLFGGGNVTYNEIISALAIAEQDGNITETIFAIDSPGGHFDGLFSLLAAMESAEKPITARVSNVAASAAFAVAAAADKIEAADKATRFGSVGVVATLHTDSNEVRVASTKAPKKAPDVTTAEGKSIVRDEIDPLHDVFVEAIAAGRSTTVEKVNAEFGQGATLLATEALSRGMIDSIAGVSLAASNTKSTVKTELPKMNLNQLRAEHPEVYAEAVQLGTTQERDRVGAHLTMGQGSGAIDDAIKACMDGSEMTATLQAKYMMAGRDNADVSARAGDENATEGAADSADAGSPAGKTDAETVAADVEAQLGITPTA